MKNVFLIGFMGSGKSTVAAMLQNEYGMRLVEMDQVLAEQEQMSISAIFEKHGEMYFRDQETQLLNRIQKEDNQVVSCGGGVILREKNVEIMKQSGVVVFLSALPETILERVKDNEDRPLLKGKKDVESISKMLNERLPKYEKAADITIQTDGKEVKEICLTILEKVKM